MAATAAPASLPTMPRAERAAARAPPPTMVAEGEASASERTRLLPPSPAPPGRAEAEVLRFRFRAFSLSGKMPTNTVRTHLSGFRANEIMPRPELNALFPKLVFSGRPKLHGSDPEQIAYLSELSLLI